MKVIKPFTEIIEDRENIYLDIEERGRICYKSEFKMEEDSEIKFIKFAKEKRHQTVLEMSAITLTIETKGNTPSLNDLRAISPWITVDIIGQSVFSGGFTYLVTGSPRAFREACEIGQPWSHFIMHILIDKYPLLFDDIVVTDRSNKAPFRTTVVDIDDYKDEGCYQFHKHMCIKFTVNRAVSHELVRHRQIILQESQRYCRYADDVVFIKPCFFIDNSKSLSIWILAMKEAEKSYLQLLGEGHSPQAARTVLPNSCKTEVLLYMSLARWKHFFTLRTSPHAEPSMLEVTRPLLKDVQEIYPTYFTEENLSVSLVGR